MKKIALFSTFLFVLAFGMASAVADKDSGCVRCHADESALKSLFIPPDIAAGEGEG